jgi:hypothetical protein
VISRLSYGAMIGLLVFSLFEAYEMQGTLSEQSLEIYRSYVHRDELLSRIRQDVWQGSVYARDFFQPRLGPGGDAQIPSG